MKSEIKALAYELSKLIADCASEDEKTENLNGIKEILHEVSPQKSEPVDCVLWIKGENVHANTWNPNHIAPPEMELLYTSIKNDGYTQPVVTGLFEDGGYEIVDGYHRWLVLSKHGDINKRVNGYLPVAKINKVKSDRMASTIRHNRARGVHDVELMSNIVKELHEMGRSEAWISKHLGMDADEILRLKQITGLAELFKNHDFSIAWEAEISEEDVLKPKNDEVLV